MIKQERFDINIQLAFLLNGDTIKWRDCQRKKYNVFAIVPPAGYVFANKCYQTEQWHLFKVFDGKEIVKASDLEKRGSLQQTLYLGARITDGKSVVVCGTRGELYLLSPKQFTSLFRNIDGTAITKAPKQWTAFSSVAETTPSGYGIQIPIKYLGIYGHCPDQVRINSLRSKYTSGHYTGDLLIISRDKKTVTLVNNEVFAMTYNQQVGGWAQSGCITPAEKLKPFTIEDAKRRYKFESEQKHTSKNASTANKDSGEEQEKVNRLMYPDCQLKSIVKECIRTAYTGSHDIVVAARSVAGKYIVYDITYEDCKRSVKSVSELCNDMNAAVNFNFREYKGRHIFKLKHFKTWWRERKPICRRNTTIEDCVVDGRPAVRVVDRTPAERVQAVEQLIDKACADIDALYKAELEGRLSKLREMGIKVRRSKHR